VAEPDSRYQICDQVVVEAFDDGALVLRLADRHLIELNSTAHYILDLINGKRVTLQVASNFADAYGLSESEALEDIMALYTQLSTLALIESVASYKPDKVVSIVTETTAASDLYIRNPDVVLREEDPNEGALLFNPDTSQIKVVNSTALFIWQQCDGTRDLAGLVAAMADAFEDVPIDAVSQDVREFVDGMVATGFIGMMGG
jgi:coenzyme PQQ synthesis protein D (PqqD)